MATRVRLIAGCINFYDPEPGWTNIHLDASDRLLWHKDGTRHPDIVASITDIPTGENEYDAIQCWQTLEHLKKYDAEKALSEFLRVLKPGGSLDVEVPNIASIACGFAEGQYTFYDLIQNLYGEQMEEMPDADLMTHRWGYDPETLEATLHRTGFGKVENISSHGGPLRIIATKAGGEA